MFSENLVQMRKLLSMTQEELAEKVGVTRQSIAKWEAGDSLPDLEKSKLLTRLSTPRLTTLTTPTDTKLATRR